MLIFIHGTDPFLAREAINKLKAKYLEKNPDGTELVNIDCTETIPNFADLKAVPLFATSRLIIIKRAGELLVAEQDNLASMLTDLPASSVVVVWDSKPFKANSPLCVILSGTANSTEDAPQSITHKATKVISVESLTSMGLKSWIKARTDELGFNATAESINELIDQYGSDLWAISTHLQSHRGEIATSLWGKIQAEKPFILFDYIRGQRWPELKKYLIASHQRGDAVEMTIGGLAAAVRKNISDQKLKQKMTDTLSEIDIALKSGLIEAGDAVALLACYLPDVEKRVQWEYQWESLI